MTGGGRRHAHEPNFGRSLDVVLYTGDPVLKILRHEDIWGSKYTDPRTLDPATSRQ